jgi:hypothetical protein
LVHEARRARLEVDDADRVDLAILVAPDPCRRLTAAATEIKPLRGLRASPNINLWDTQKNNSEEIE